MSEPLVSVVVPTRNRASLVSRAVASVVRQRDVDLEVLVVDDASDEGCAARLDGLAGGPVSVLHLPRRSGVAAARNAGVARSTGPWVAFLDDDDLWGPDKLAVQLGALSDRPGTRWACSGAVVVDERLRIERADWAPPDGDVIDQLLEFNIIPAGASNVVIDAGLLREVGGFDPELAHLADWDLWCRIALRSPVAPVQRPLVAYVRHGASMSHNMFAAEAELAYVIAKHDEVRRRHGVGMRTEWHHDSIAKAHLRAGRRWPAARIYLELARRHGAFWLPRALASAVWPGVVRLRDGRRRRDVPDDWRREAEAWLAPYRNQGSGAAPASMATSGPADPGAPVP